jgi:hypothetical protein
MFLLFPFSAIFWFGIFIYLPYRVIRKNSTLTERMTLSLPVWFILWICIERTAMKQQYIEWYMHVTNFPHQVASFFAFWTGLIIVWFLVYGIHWLYYRRKKDNA